MPVEQVDHVFAGQMARDAAFPESVMLDRPPMVSAESAPRHGMLSGGRPVGGMHEPIDVPMNNQALAAVQDLYKKFKAPV
jgi:hypothetical protein